MVSSELLPRAKPTIGNKTTITLPNILHMIKFPISIWHYMMRHPTGMQTVQHCLYVTLRRSLDKTNVESCWLKSLDCKTVRIFAFSSTREQSNIRSGMRLKTESETVRLARFARVRLYATLYRFIYWFWERNRPFCSLSKVRPVSNFAQQHAATCNRVFKRTQVYFKFKFNNALLSIQ